MFWVSDLIEKWGRIFEPQVGKVWDLVNYIQQYDAHLHQYHFLVRYHTTQLWFRHMTQFGGRHSIQSLTVLVLVGRHWTLSRLCIVMTP